MSDSGIHLAVEQGVGTITICNEAKRNAMTLSMWETLPSAVHELQNTGSVRVVVVTGQGDGAFVSGADIGEFAQRRSSAEAVVEYDQAVIAAQRAIADCNKPTVARIQGVCMGGGIGVALACDLRYASNQARFRMPAARLGLGYAFDGMQRLVQMLGAPCAFDLLYTARVLDAFEARRIGFVNDVFDTSVFSDSVRVRAGQIAANAPLSLRAAKAAILAALPGAPVEARAAVDTMVKECFASRDYIEGQAAFKERREPWFEGR